MKAVRLLLCLFVVVALAMPPLAAQAGLPDASSQHAAASSSQDAMECPHHFAADRSHEGHDERHEERHDDKHHGERSIVHSCCSSAPFGWAVTATADAERRGHTIDRSLRASPALNGFVLAKDPPPPRV